MKDARQHKEFIIHFQKKSWLLKMKELPRLICSTVGHLSRKCGRLAWKLVSWRQCAARSGNIPGAFQNPWLAAHLNGYSSTSDLKPPLPYCGAKLSNGSTLTQLKNDGPRVTWTAKVMLSELNKMSAELCEAQALIQGAAEHVRRDILRDRNSLALGLVQYFIEGADAKLQTEKTRLTALAKTLTVDMLFEKDGE